MKYDSYSRFLKSDIFLNHKKCEEQEENSPEAQTAAKRASRIYNTWYDESLQEEQYNDLITLRNSLGLEQLHLGLEKLKTFLGDTYLLNCLND